MRWRKTGRHPGTSGSFSLTVDTLKEKLSALTKGRYLPISYEEFGAAFPPGPRDDYAREQALRLAETFRLQVRYLQEDEEVHFIKS